jgi:spermidine synthase
MTLGGRHNSVMKTFSLPPQKSKFLSLSFLILLGYGVIFLTGAAGLVYQVTWQKYLSRLLGADSTATAIILATFLGGLSLGYYLCGKFSARIKYQLLGFALLEGTIGIWCLAFPMVFTAVDVLTRSWSFSPPFWILFQGVLCSAFLIGVPTICMGGTVPLMTRGISQNLKEATSVHATIYSINTAGAVLGALLAGFYLIPRFGLPFTVRGTALVNLGACLFFLLIASRFKPQPSAETKPVSPGKAQQTSHRFPAPILYTVALTSGFYVMTLENVLIRFTNFSMGSSSYSFSLIVAVFILSIAVGSYIVARLPKIDASLLFWNQFLIAISLLGIYYSLDTWPYWAHVIRIGFQPNSVGFWQYYSFVFLSLTVILILPVGCMGATIPIAFHELKRDLHTVGKHSGLLLAWNTIGNLTGSIIGGIAFYYFFNNDRIFLFAVLLAACSACFIARSMSGTYFFSGGLLAILALCFLMFTPLYDQNRFMAGTFVIQNPLEYSLNGPKSFFENRNRRFTLLFYDDDPVSTVAVVDNGVKPIPKQDNLSIMVNGKSDSATTGDIYTTKLLAHLPALLARERKEVLVIGLGTGVTAGELTLYPDIEHIDVAEISPAVIAALPYFKDSTYAVHENPKLRILAGDAFRILGRNEKKWDIVISEPSNPWVTGVDLLFTREFYKMVRTHLTSDGMFLQWVQNYAISENTIGMILNTVKQEFPNYRVFWSTAGDLLILASTAPLTLQDVKRAEAVLQKNDRVRESLGAINLNTIDSLLLREVWTPSFAQKIFSGYDIQTMDQPRLHYIAGKDFFIGKDLYESLILGPLSVPFVSEYLLAIKYPDWKTHAFSKDEYVSLAVSLRSIVDNTVSRSLSSLAVKAFMGNPSMYPLSNQEFREMGLDVLQFVVATNLSDLDWGRIGLKNATFRQKVQVLRDHVLRTRNWIVPYPLVGLEALLEEGISESRDPYERTWCALQLSLLLSQEKADKRLVKNVLDKVIRQNGGKMPVADEDRYLLETVNKMMTSLP